MAANKRRSRREATLEQSTGWIDVDFDGLAWGLGLRWWDQDAQRPMSHSEAWDEPLDEGSALRLLHRALAEVDPDRWAASL